jgi:hypothetical protein
MKKNLLKLMLVIFIVSCSENSPENPIENPNLSNPLAQGKLKKEQDIKNGVVLKTSEYEYNSQGNISKLTINDNSKIYETTFSYNANNVMTSWFLKEFYISNPSSKKEQTNSIEYVNNKITNICIDRTRFYSSNNFFKEVDKIEYTYGIGLLPTSIIHYSPVNVDNGNTATCSDVTYTTNIETFEYVNDNMTRYSSGDTSFSNTYNVLEFDNKINPKSTIKPDAFKYSLGNSTKNNVSKILIYNTTTNALKATAIYENTYNSNDFLEKTIEKYYNAGSTTPTSTVTVNYTYY